MKKCSVADICGGCQYQGIPYSKQLELKQQKVEKLLGSFGKVEPIIGCDDPYHYRNKVQVSFGQDHKGRILMGNYVPSTHTIVPVRECQIASNIANEIFNYIFTLIKSFKLTVFDEQGMRGLIRHVLVRCSKDEEEVMVVIVTGSPVFPKKKDFMKALLDRFPNITTIVQNVNNRHTSMILGERNITWYGKGYIVDELCGLEFYISPHSFYQVNHDQTEKLYATAKKFANIQGNETVLDAYCGIGTIGMTFADEVKKVIGVEINEAAVKDAVKNAKHNGLDNMEFYCEDAGRFMSRYATEKKKIDIAIMDPPRKGADNRFLSSLVKMDPEKIVYISCNPVTLKDNLHYLTKTGYVVTRIQPLDMFPFTDHVETVCLLGRRKPDRT